MPDVPPIRVRRDAGQLRVGVIHVEDFVPQNVLEDRSRGRIVVDQLAIDRKSAGGRFLGHMQECEQTMIRFAVDPEIVETVAARQRIPGEAHGAAGLSSAQQRSASFAEQIAVAQLVDRVLEVQTSQQRIRRHLRSAQDIASAVGFDLGKGEELSQPAIDISPHPSMDWTHQVVQRRTAFHCGHGIPRAVSMGFMQASGSPLNDVSRHDRSSPPIVETAIAAVGVALVAATIAANQSWLDRHFLPSFFMPRHWYVLIESTVRCVVGGAGALLVFGRARLARLMAHAWGTALQVVVAAMLAIVASEFALRWVQPRPTEWLAAEEEPRRQVDSQLGWVLAKARVGRSRISGRTIEYAIDAAGDRVQRVDDPVDHGRPVIVFVGESVMFGEGLAWDESIPAQVGAKLEIQSANLAVHGYSTDQMYLRLTRELPRFTHPDAVVSIFMTELFGRNLDQDRPHLGPGLEWHPAEQAPRVVSLTGLLVPYRRDATVDLGVSMTREVLRAIVRLAHSRGAAALVVVPQFGGEDDVQRALRERIFTEDIPQLLVRLDPDWRLPWDRHPNARGAQAIAAAVAARLRDR